METKPVHRISEGLSTLFQDKQSAIYASTVNSYNNALETDTVVSHFMPYSVTVVEMKSLDSFVESVKTDFWPRYGDTRLPTTSMINLDRSIIINQT